MNKIKPLAITSIVVLLWNCSSNKNLYNIPPDLTDSDKKEFISKFNHGVRLYKINCEKCHSNNTKSPDKGPNFTQAKIRTYEVFLKMRNQTHEFTQKMNANDIDDIIIYLKYRIIQ